MSEGRYEASRPVVWQAVAGPSHGEKWTRFPAVAPRGSGSSSGRSTVLIMSFGSASTLVSGGPYQANEAPGPGEIRKARRYPASARTETFCARHQPARASRNTNSFSGSFQVPGHAEEVQPDGNLHSCARLPLSTVLRIGPRDLGTQQRPSPALSIRPEKGQLARPSRLTYRKQFNVETGFRRDPSQATLRVTTVVADVAVPRRKVAVECRDIQNNVSTTLSSGRAASQESRRRRRCAREHWSLRSSRRHRLVQWPCRSP